MDGLLQESPEALLQLFRSLVQTAMTTRFFMVAVYAWAVYDWLLTLKQEVLYVWIESRGWKSRFLYFFTRYYGLALLTYDITVTLNSWSASFCHSYYYIVGACGLCQLWAIGGTLQLRVYVLYERSKLLLIINGVLFLVEAALGIAFFLLNVIGTQAVDTPPGLTGCWVNGLSGPSRKYTKDMLYVCLAYECYLTLLVLRVGLSNWRNRSYTLLDALVRDSFIWFVLLIACLAWNAVAWTTLSTTWILTGYPALHASANVGGSRLLLNLRSAYFASLQARSLAGPSNTILSDPTEFRSPLDPFIPLANFKGKDKAEDEVSVGVGVWADDIEEPVEDKAMKYGGVVLLKDPPKPKPKIKPPLPTTSSGSGGSPSPREDP